MLTSDEITSLDVKHEQYQNNKQYEKSITYMKCDSLLLPILEVY